jgi:amino-acid N-acetyltransferase
MTDASVPPQRSAIITRRATPDDAAAIQALIDLYVPNGTLLPRTQAFIQANARDFIVAVGNGVVVGCVHLDEYAPSLAELRSLAVDPTWQGAGVGRTLVFETERLAAIRGHAILFAVSNDEEFFGRFGFLQRYIPELDVERSEVSRFKGVYAKDLPRVESSWPAGRSVSRIFASHTQA